MQKIRVSQAQPSGLPKSYFITEPRTKNKGKRYHWATKPKSSTAPNMRDTTPSDLFKEGRAKVLAGRLLGLPPADACEGILLRGRGAGRFRGLGLWVQGFSR